MRAISPLRRETVFEEISQALERAEPGETSVVRQLPCPLETDADRAQSKDGEAAPIAARKVLTFKASPVLVARINGEIIEDGHCQRRNR